MQRCSLVVVAMLALACGDGGSASGSGTSSSGGASSSAADESSTSAGPSDELAHGIVELQLDRALDQTAMPYAGTTHVVVTLQYRECLVAFYDAHPELREEGPAGPGIFGGADQGGEGWRDRLCVDGDGFVACTIESIEQQLDVVPQLSVRYAVATDMLEEQRLRFGPLPTAAAAMCGAGLLPSVRVGGGDAVHGESADGSTIWGAAAYSPAEAATDMGPIIRVTPEG